MLLSLRIGNHQGCFGGQLALSSAEVKDQSIVA